LLSLDNLAGAVAFLIEAPGPLGRPLIVADPEPLTLSEMVAAMRRGLGRRPALFPVPPKLLETSLDALGRANDQRFATGSLVANPAALIGIGWKPEVTTAQGLERLMREERAGS
ncbi:MAG: NAD-dependent dehydratase, partial [Xanthobacteraceae bacterium]|nr:NAD-dependent dehydratase [Xanthobacteraceae bacterium]